MLPALTRGQKLLALTAVVIIALFVTGVATQDGSGEQSDPSQHPLVKTLGRWFGGPDPVTGDELSAPCLSAGRLTIEDICVLSVAPSDKDIREVRLHAEDAVRISVRAPHDDEILDEDVEAGEDLNVAVDGDGVEITLTCGECTIVVGE